MDMEALKAPLDSKNVKDLAKGGTKVQYIEAWHAIAEANRIFGFDGWSRETLDMKCVSDRERKVGGGDGFNVAYTARVRITVGDVVREGVVTRDGFGAGTQIDRDHGKAHEGASKEAESDANNRALMTFGNVFGLALYDKSRANVEDVEDREARERFAQHLADKLACIKTINNMPELVAFWKSLEHGVKAAPEMIKAKDDRKAAIEEMKETE